MPRTVGVVILIDTPAWPAHGTVWAHLVSDTSLLELRHFARAADLPDRGFDLDHYDVPQRRHADLVAAGATPVDGRELARRLAASGLRVPGHERAGAKRAALRTRWTTLWTTPSDDVAAVGEDLVERWSEPHRVYHGRLHLMASLDALDTLLADEPTSPEDALVSRLALWFHDAVHDGEAGRDEERSAALASAALTGLGLTSSQVTRVVDLVLMTATHDPSDRLSALVSDADLAILGGTPQRYGRYVHQVRAEYAEVPDADFRTGRAAVLRQLLSLPTLFRTGTGATRWAAQAHSNLSTELASLGG